MDQPQDGTPDFSSNTSNIGDNLEEAQNNLIADHYRNPRNIRPLTNPDIQATEVNPFCGDETTVQVRMQNGILREVGTHAVGCSICHSSLSMLSEAVQNLTLAGA